MKSINFFTPVCYLNADDIKSRLVNGIEGYFSLGGKTACVIPGKKVNGCQEVEMDTRAHDSVHTALKVISYVTVVIPILMIVAKAAFRSTHTFRQVSSVSRLEEGIEIDDETIRKVQECMEKVIQRKSEEGVHLFNSQNDHRVFTLKTAPEFVFKLGTNTNSQAMTKRFEQMVNAGRICRTHDLGLLVIPNAKLITIEHQGVPYQVLVEKQLKIEPSDTLQEQIHEEQSTVLSPAIRQLVTFIAKSGFSDVDWRNIPILDGKKIALVDLEEMNGAKAGIFGERWPKRRGLIRCVGKEQIDTVITEAKKQGIVDHKKAQTAKQERHREIDQNQRLKAFYSEQKIQTGAEPLQVTLDSLGLDLNCSAQVKYGKNEWKVTLKEVAQKMIDEMNKQLQEHATMPAALKGKRRLYINVNNPDFVPYDSLGLPNGTGLISEEDLKQKWMTRIIQAMIDQKYLFALEKVNGHGYFIQA